MRWGMRLWAWLSTGGGVPGLVSRPGPAGHVVLGDGLANDMLPAITSSRPYGPPSAATAYMSATLVRGWLCRSPSRSPFRRQRQDRCAATWFESLPYPRDWSAIATASDCSGMSRTGRARGSGDTRVMCRVAGCDGSARGSSCYERSRAPEIAGPLPPGSGCPATGLGSGQRGRAGPAGSSAASIAGSLSASWSALPGASW